MIRCNLFGHRWEFVSASDANTFAEHVKKSETEDALPLHRRTRILQECARCGEFDVIAIDGNWAHVLNEENADSVDKTDDELKRLRKMAGL